MRQRGGEALLPRLLGSAGSEDRISPRGGGLIDMNEIVHRWRHTLQRQVRGLILVLHERAQRP